MRVIVTDGSGFVRGEVFDDSRGLPLLGVTASLVIAGGIAVVTPQPMPADDRGRFTLPAASGAALVKVERDGFTSVERQADLARGAVSTLLDARLTRLDSRVTQVQSVFGGEAASADGSAALSVPSGSLDADTALRVTAISNQGLQGVLPVGWSPIAVVDVQPAGRLLTQPATLRLPHADTLAAGSPVALALYDAAQHRWVVQAPGRVSDDRRTLTASINATGQFAFVVPDESPVVPPPAVPGQALAGVAAVAVPATSTATGLVVPRSAPPGDAARAVGTIVLQPPVPQSSGAVLRARVTEQFDLLDSSRVVPLQFVQDAVLYARPRVGGAGTLAARLPISPSLQFTIQQLSLGTVRLDVTIDEPSASSAIVGSAGGSLTDEAGNVLELPPGALTADIALGLLPLGAGQLSAPVPTGLTLLGAVLVDLVGASFDQPARLSIPRPAGLDAASQVLVAQVITDGAGGRRFKIVGIGADLDVADFDPNHPWRAQLRRRQDRWRVCLLPSRAAARFHYRPGQRARHRHAGAGARHHRHRAVCVRHHGRGHVCRRGSRRCADDGGGDRAGRGHGVDGGVAGGAERHRHDQPHAARRPRRR